MYRRVRPSDSSHQIDDGLLMEASDPCGVFEEAFDIPDGHKPVLGFKLIGPGGVRYSYVNNTYKGSAKDKRNHCVYVPTGLWTALGLEDPDSDVIYLEPVRSLPVAQRITIKTDGCSDPAVQEIIRDSMEGSLMYAVLIEKGSRSLEMMKGVLDEMGISAIIECIEDSSGVEGIVMLSGREVELIIEDSSDARPQLEAPAVVAAATAVDDAYPFGIPELAGVRVEPERFIGPGRVEATEMPALTKEQVRAQRLARLG